MISSVQLWSVRDALAADPAKTLHRLAAAGFTALEPFDLADLADHHSSTIVELGLSVPSAHVPLIGQADLSAAVAAAGGLGTRTLIDSGRRDGWDDPATISEYARQLNALAHDLVGSGLEVGYHNHWWEVATVVEGRSALDRFVEELDPRVRLEIDIYWAAIGGADVPALLQGLGERVAMIHVKDGAVSPDPPAGSQVPVGTGHVPIEASLAAAPNALRVFEFDEYAGDVFEALEAGRRFVSELEGTR